MSFFVVDVEADGPIPSKYSMIRLGAVVVEPTLSKTFDGFLWPVSDEFIPEALAVSGFSRNQCLKFDDPQHTMNSFYDWIENENKDGRPIFISDNLAFDWQFINYYFHIYCNSNPFGFSGRRIGDLYCGMKMDAYSKWKHLRKTKHDHNPVNDAKGNAEAILKMKEMGLKINLK